MNYYFKEERMTDQVQAWIDEAGDEPTPFGKVVIRIGWEQGFPLIAEDSGVLGLEERHALLLVDHLDGVGDKEEDPRDFVQAVAYALGLDPDNPEDAGAYTALAATHLFGDRWLDRTPD